jgi:hypothetical protein
MPSPKQSWRVVYDLNRFRVVEEKGVAVLMVRSGRLSGDETWYEANDLGEYRGFVTELVRSKEGK